MPPIDAPQTCAAGDAQRVEHADARRRPCRRACTGSLTAGRARSAASRARGSARRRSSKPWLRPMSRLSKRMTRKPRATRLATKSSGQPISCMPRPMIEQQRLAAAASRGRRLRARCRWRRSASVRQRAVADVAIGAAGAEEPAPRAARVERLPLRRSAAPADRRPRTAPADSCPCRCGWRGPRCSRSAGPGRSGCTARRRCRRCANRSRSSAPAAACAAARSASASPTLLPAQQLEDAPGVGRLRMAGERRAERDRRSASASGSSLAISRAYTPPRLQPIRLTRLAVALGERAHVGGAALEHAVARAEVEALAPGLR